MDGKLAGVMSQIDSAGSVHTRIKEWTAAKQQPMEIKQASSQWMHCMLLPIIPNTTYFPYQNNFCYFVTFKVL